MLKTGILHPQLARVMAELRHMDMLVIADAGLPIPKGVERVDLGWKPGCPKYLEVLEEIEKYMITEKAIFAKEALIVSPELHEKSLALLPKGIPVEYIPHKELKKMTEEAKAIVLTGEFTGYTNVILISGCAY
ncbi:D-ribose pyranase [Lacrimispora algidixylanolytica]|uniref:D-ribose pyranase n=1 Tax=Lacrimispora algidixylanolytica TaxID=94868 RepID=A0A419STG8_9FIRM|nr:D-ribose pyranase [Lacrimispora algidixylanolytica]RKD28539.1 D-ribose pyranase [Lacrimispora algidixylanolytica]